MQTRDHKVLGELLMANTGFNIPYLYRKAFILGSIEPDMNPFTYLHGFTKGVKFHGHNYGNVLSVMKKLFDSVQEQKYFGARFYYRLGKLTHYIADAFTFPHNKGFHGGLREHCRYESTLHEEFSGMLQKHVAIGIRPGNWNSFQCVEILHKEYMKEAGGCEIDCRYILQAAAMLVWGRENCLEFV